MQPKNRKEIIDFLKSKNLFAKKSLGQNFLVNEQILEKILETAKLNQEDQTIEVGPGLGVLTQALCLKTKKVIAIELDTNLTNYLKTTLDQFKNLEIINQDALKYLPKLKPYKVVANIPYYITSPLINHFLQSENQPKSITLLVQKEVAQKSCTINPDMSILSLQIALFAKAKYIQAVSKENFFPVPKVDSAILHIELYSKTDPNYLDQKTALKILNLAKRAFSQGRKKLSNTLPELKEKLKTLNLNEKRPEHLSITDWKKILDQN